MKIMSHCNSAYFKYAEGLVKSIRHSGNDNHIVLKLQDFPDANRDYALTRLKNIDNIDLDFIDTNKQEYGIDPLKYINDPNARKSQLYTDSMPFLVHEMLNNYDDDVLKISANGLVFTDLSEIEQTLTEKDFIFRERGTRVSKSPTGIKNIEDVLFLSQGRNLEKMLNNSYRQTTKRGVKTNPLSELAHLQSYLKLKGGILTIQEMVHLSISRPVLLGTLAISNKPMTRLFVKTWKNYILEERSSGKTFYTSFKNKSRKKIFEEEAKNRNYEDPLHKLEKKRTPPNESDTREDDSFVRAYIKFIRHDLKISRKTDLWKGNLIDSSCLSDRIWFAKGSIKNGGGKHGQGKRYLEKLNFFRSLYN